MKYYCFALTGESSFHASKVRALICYVLYKDVQIDSSFSVMTEPRPHQVRGERGRNSNAALKAKANFFLTLLIAILVYLNPHLYPHQEGRPKSKMLGPWLCRYLPTNHPS